MKEGKVISRVRVDGEEAALHITDQAVMFERRGSVSGFERNAIRLVKPEGDAMLIAYSAGSEVKSVRVEPIMAVASLLMPASGSGASQNESQIPVTAMALNEVFERLYRETRRELEERLAMVQDEPENKNLRLTPDEERKYSRVWKQMTNLVGAKYGFDPSAEGNSMMFHGLEKEPYERQLDTIKIHHIDFLREMVAPKAESADISFSIENVWPWDLERILLRSNLIDRPPLLKDEYLNYLRRKWTKYLEGWDDRPKPVIVLP